MRHNILIAEDEPKIASFIQKGLTHAGFATAVAEDGNKALNMLLNDDFELLLLDLGLPEKDGWQVIVELQNRSKKPPVIIIVTARDDVQDRINSEKFDVAGYITKPFKFRDLLEQVKAQFN
jgi:DNA-binding response OmpR family regulator